MVSRTTENTQLSARPSEKGLPGSVRGKGGSVSCRLQRGLMLIVGVGPQPVPPLDVAEHERLPGA
mgnify:CR=1 FL=1